VPVSVSVLVSTLVSVRVCVPVLVSVSALVSASTSTSTSISMPMPMFMCISMSMSVSLCTCTRASVCEALRQITHYLCLFGHTYCHTLSRVYEAWGLLWSLTKYARVYVDCVFDSVHVDQHKITRLFCRMLSLL